MNNEKIKIELAGGGFIVVERNPDPDYDGVSVFYETENGGFYYGCICSDRGR